MLVSHACKEFVPASSRVPLADPLDKACSSSVVPQVFAGALWAVLLYQSVGKWMMEQGRVVEINANHLCSTGRHTKNVLHSTAPQI